MKRKINKRIIDQNGYKQSNSKNFTNYKLIPSNNISMDDVKSTILGIMLDKNGNPQGFEFMQPGTDYIFPSSDSVMEIPKYQDGANTGYKPPIFTGGTFEQFQAYVKSLQTGQPITNQQPLTQNVPVQNPTVQGDSNDLTMQQAVHQGMGNEWMTQNEANLPGNFINIIDPYNATSGVEDMSIFNDDEQLQRMEHNKAINTLTYNYDEDGQAIDENPDFNQPNPFQFFNPYAGVDIPTAAFTLGTSIKEGNTLGTVASGVKLAAGLGRNFLSGMGLANRQKQVMQGYKRNQRDYITGANRPQYMAEGGQIEKALTGEYLFGMDKENPMVEPNAEIEKNEFVRHPSGEIQQAEGKTHEQGGIDVNLEDGTKILSDHLKLGGTNAKYFRDKFDLELKAADTYATILDKFNRKSGLKKIVEEQEDLVKQIDKQQKNTEDEESFGLNMQFLSGKMKDLEDKKKPLEEARKILFDEVYKAQEQSKPKEERDESVFQDGGYVNFLAEKYGITPDRANELLAEFQNGGGYTPEQRRDRFRDFYRQSKILGYEGDVNPDAADLNVEAGKLQSWMISNYPDAVSDYAKGVDMTAKGVDILKANNPEIFTSLGLNLNKPSAAFTPQEKQLLSRAATEQGAVDDNFWRDQFNDNKWSYRFPVVPLQTRQNGDFATPPITATIPTANTTPSSTVVDPSDVEQGTVVEDYPDAGQEGYNMGVFLMPDQNPLPPTSLQPHLKVNRRFDRVTPALLSPEQSLEEIRRQEMSANDQIDMLPDSQRTAALATLNANTQQNINKAVSETAKINSQIQTQADMQNAQTQRMEENAAAQDALSYEQRQLTAVARTQNDYANYYNTTQANNVRNFNTINDLNLLNAMYDDYQFTGTGVEKTSPDIQWRFNNSVPKKEVEKKKTTKKKYGGRFGK